MQMLWMVVGAFFFATMGVCIKYAAEHFNTAEIVLYRGLIGMVLMWALAAAQGVSLRTRLARMHAGRSTVGACAMGCSFYAITHIPLASATTLNTMSSLWMAVILMGAALWTWRPSSRVPRQPLNLPLVGAVAVGFAGVVLMLQPSFADDQMVPALVGLLSGLLSALAYIQVVALSKAGEPETRTVFYFNVACAVSGALAMWLWMGVSQWPSWSQAAWLLPMGLFAAAGQLCMTRAYTHARNSRGTLVVANLQYFGIVFASLYSLFLFGDALGWQGWVGMALVAASGMAATVLRAKQ